MKLDMLLNRRETLGNENANHAVIMENASFSWQGTPSLVSLHLKIRSGNLVGVKGAIGAGKSSLLAAILGEINLISGNLKLYVNSISYAPQSAWIFADTIRANILLGKPMDEERYKNVIKACCLDIDLHGFGEIGDLLMIGDKGVNLSGGQKARISLARALYADADLYLLDDPLAAVDPKVAKNIFDQCIGPRSLLRGKTRILVTHQTHFLVETDQIILLTYGRLDELNIEQRPTIELSNDSSESDSSHGKETLWVVNTDLNDKNSIVKSETSVDGDVKWSIWLELFTSPPLGWFGLFLMIIFMLGSEALYDFTNSWLALWSAEDEKKQRSSYYAYVYLGVIIATLIVALIRAGYIFYIMLRALRHQIDPSAAALSISYCITLTGLFQWSMRQSAEAENFMTSAERVHEYGQLLPESHQNSQKSNVLIQPTSDWPSRGIIEFKDYTFRYRPELDPVLKNLNLRIQSTEKIGVIGRTGMLSSHLESSRK
ncbi:unnamed protein product [Rotaria sp. Silwood2]|nr:unnamed protein product [Rotaria sp. Silwood2]CAF3071250.1 unnamed protein product [Rotaria sp. Silwood2]CAF4312438.1 unnamed protein product [Rotaria sp. Silwood2]CAF4399176.1 unnamed protein product [Rotaria sp. Silwood2]